VIALFLAVAASFVASLGATPVLMRSLKARGIGQQIRDDGPVEHPHVKKVGTPTMGGFAIVGGAVVGYLIAHLRRGDFKFSRSGLLLMALIVACMCVGALDDYLGIRNQRNLGLRKRGKVIGLIVIGGAFAAVAVHWARVSTHLSFTHETGVDLRQWGWIVFAVVIILSTTNGANLTDGLDGLLSGTGTLVFGVYAIIAFWEFRHFGTYTPPGAKASLLYPYTVQPAQALDLMTVAGAMLGGCTGFLWWNAAPARIFMGDTGSMAIGGGMAGLALFTNTQLLLPIIGGLCLVETLSVIAQVISFRGFGRRILRMSPIHHHFELLGWPETTITVRFWIFAGLCAAFGLGLFYADFLRLPGVLN
jgi:phospho-N-acetylmuramoyl-pentapeptide-transferase